MIRFILALLLIHFSFSLVSCTSSETQDTATPIDEAGSAPIDESGLADAGATGKSTGEDNLENELENPDQAAAAPEKQGAEQASPVVDDELEKELSGEDNKPIAATEQPPKADDLEPAPAPPVAATEEPAAPPAELTPAPAPAPEKAKVTDIRYMANANGGTVVIETTKPITYQSRMNAATQQFVIEMADVELPSALQRPYNMKEFGSRFGGINAYQSPGSSTARVVIQLSGPMTTDPIVQQEGTSLVVIPPAAPPPVAAAPTPSKPVATQGKEEALGAKSLSDFLTGNQRFYGRPISLQVKGADIRDVINFLAEESGANVVMSDDVTGKISLKLRRIPWDQALVTIMRSKGLGYVRQGNVLRISTMKSLQTETEAASKMIEAQKASVPSVVQVIPISYAAMEEILKAVTPFLTKEIGKAVADNRTSTLIVTDKSDVVDRISRLVKTLDIAPPQVSIESKIVEAVEGFENFVGISWNASGSPVHLSPSGGANGAPIDLTPGPFSSTTLSHDFSGTTPFSATLGVGTLDILGSLSATLTLAERDSLAKVISAPRISAMNREKSSIVQQGEAISITATKSEQTGAVTKAEKRTPFKLELDVTPQITADGGVIMDLDVQREFLGPLLDPETQSRAINTRKAHTKVLVRNGQTAVIGGIYTSDETEATNGVPGLQNIPILGWLFKNKSFSRDKNELLIFMTPRILSNENAATEQASAN